MGFQKFISGLTVMHLLIFIIVILLAILVVVLSDKFSRIYWRKKDCLVFRGYQTDYPECWRECYQSAKGRMQSPINIRPKCTMIVPTSSARPLIFNSQYFNLPKSIQIVNDGYGILVGANFEDGEFPMITGGPLKRRYRFNLAQFKWGPTDFEGSEHTIDSIRYGMELQLTHIRGEKCYENLDAAVNARAVLILSYLFEVTPIDNPYLAPIVQALRHVRKPNSSCILDPFPLSWIFHPFKTKYYYYQGSITCPPCTEGTEWIVQPEPLSISSEQLRCFRCLEAVDGPMRTNVRPVQKINNRTVYFYD